MQSVTPQPKHTLYSTSGQMHPLPLYIRGRWQAGGGDTFTSFNPADGTVVWEGSSADADDVGEAVSAAREAFPDWADSGFEARLKIVEKFRSLLESHKDTLAELISRETGKILWDSRSEVSAMIGKVAISAKAWQERTGYHESPLPDGGKAILQHRPHGVVAVFGPYNFPGHLPNGHILPALLAGNTVVFKPSELTPAVAAYTVQLWHEAGLPSGVINLLHGEKKTGIALANHTGIDGLFFTGSSATGMSLHKQFSGRPEKILALEMGGNNPLIVHEVKDIKAAAYITVQSAFLSSGQRCTCTRRLIVPEGKAGDNFLDILAGMTRSIRVGAYDDTPEPFMGPLVSLVESEKLMQAEEDLLAGGAKPLVPLQRLKDDFPFLSPGLLDVTHANNRKDEEFFGPLLQVIRVKDFDAAVDEANNTAYGLAAGLVSDNRALYNTFARRIRAGIVNWNRPTTGASSAAPFGGVGRSGNHRPSAYYAADYCAWPTASMESEKPAMPEQIPPGIVI